MRFVVDSSVSLSWCFPDEATPVTTALFELARRSELVVPPLWHLEMGNVLGVHLRRGRITPEWLDQILASLAKFDIHTELVPGFVDIPTYLFDMRLHRLTAYDATYLVLAKQGNLPIATFDNEIIAAAHRAGVSVIQPPE